MKVPEQTRSWLLDSPYPRVRYRAQMVFEPENADRRQLLEDPLVAQIIESLSDWEEQVLKRFLVMSAEEEITRVRRQVEGIFFQTEKGGIQWPT